MGVKRNVWDNVTRVKSNVWGGKKVTSNIVVVSSAHPHPNLSRVNNQLQLIYFTGMPKAGTPVRGKELEFEG